MDILTTDDVRTLRETGDRVQFTRDHLFREGEQVMAWAHVCKRGRRAIKVKVVMGKVQA